MNNIDIKEVCKNIENLCIKLKRRIHKEDINKENGFEFHYNTYMNAGLKLRDFSFSEILYNENSKLCKNCNNKIPYLRRKNVYCSSSCSAKVNNKIRKNDRIKVKTCPNCNKLFKKNQRKFCSRKCSNLFIFNTNYNLWSESKLPKNKSNGSKSIIKKYILLENEYKCFQCGINQYNNKKLTLELDHIDGDGTNDNKNNVRLLCPNCHGLTPTFKGKNIGNGKREWRKKRYHEGKSY